MTFPVSGPGSVGMEMSFANMVDPGAEVIVCRNGVFGGRMIEVGTAEAAAYHAYAAHPSHAAPVRAVA